MLIPRLKNYTAQLFLAITRLKDVIQEYNGHFWRNKAV
jgi:hypothetical protein